MKKIFLISTVISLSSGISYAQTTVTDIDGNVYNTIAIGTQLWMKENLRTTKYNDGTPIAYPGANDSAWQYNYTGAYAWYNNDSATYSDYGILYNWFALSPTTNGGRNICPAGWHVATSSEWNKMEKYLDPTTDTTLYGSVGTTIGAQIKESGTAHWYTGNTGTNTSGFTALGGGGRSESGAYSYYTSNANFWTATPYGSTAWYRRLQYNSSRIYKYDLSKNSGWSVRAVRDGLTTGLMENNPIETIFIYPNPSEGTFTISQNNISKTEIEIYNLMGTLIYKTQFANLQITIDLSNLSKGIYLVKLIDTNRNIHNQKIIIQ
ncbi:MAG: hypothetical protein A3F72_20915 [Bacteroidetes bacterium RIFCSPLOWO2_12_FULL_35_15]|nr:MAG: hypothetical protein A3F72_20915 [Bacteroidetes bacterium RIFCSPLOWO2_12_FULL_35_15]